VTNPDSTFREKPIFIAENLPDYEIWYAQIIGIVGLGNTVFEVTLGNPDDGVSLGRNLNGSDCAATVKRVSKAVEKSINANMFCGALNDHSTCNWDYKKTRKFFSRSARPLKMLVAGSVDPEKCFFRYKCSVVRHPLTSFPEIVFLVLNEANSGQDLGMQVVNDLGHTICFWRWKDITECQYLLKNDKHEFSPVSDWLSNVDTDGYIYMEGFLYTVNALRQLVPHYFVMREIWFYEFRNEQERQANAEPTGPFRIVAVEDWERKGGCGFKIELAEDKEGEALSWELVCHSEHQKTMWVDMLSKRIAKYELEREAETIKPDGTPKKGGFLRPDRSGNNQESDEEEDADTVNRVAKRDKVPDPKATEHRVAQVIIHIKGSGKFKFQGELHMLGSQLIQRQPMSREWATLGKPSAAAVMSFTMQNNTLIYEEVFKGAIGEKGLSEHGM
jgi:hypothetical protein